MTATGQGGSGRKVLVGSFLDAGLASVGAFAWPKLPSTGNDAPGRKVLLSHLPCHGESHGADRYSRFILCDEGQWLRHSHLHGKFHSSGRGINLGVDVHGFALVSGLVLARMDEPIDDESRANAL